MSNEKQVHDLSLQFDKVVAVICVDFSGPCLLKS
jgi:hypothetical protein